MPDLFNGDAIPVSSPEGPALNLTEWRTRHAPAEIDRIVGLTLDYMRNELGFKRVGGVGYCFGGKYVPRFLAQGKGVDVGFIAHPSSLETVEIQGIAGPISIAAGGEMAFILAYTKNTDNTDWLQSWMPRSMSPEGILLKTSCRRRTRPIRRICTLGLRTASPCDRI